LIRYYNKKEYFTVTRQLPAARSITWRLKLTVTQKYQDEVVIRKKQLRR